MQSTRFVATVSAALAVQRGRRTLEQLPEVSDELYTKQVLDLVAAAVHRGEVASVPKDVLADLGPHTERVLGSAGFLALGARARLVGQALCVQEQQQVQRRHRRKDRLREAALAASKSAHESPDASPSRGLDAAKGEKDGSREEAEVARPEQSWTEVQAFRTQEEALRFVLECQPFDYAPELPPGSPAFPRFETGREAYAYVLTVDPLPAEFTSTCTEFKRRLRVRLLDPADSKLQGLGKATARRTVAKGLTARNRVATAQEAKPWVVEAAGPLFDRPEALSDLRERTSRFFIAVSPDVEKRVLTEGFKVTKRCSIPCSATPQEALAAFNRHEQKNGRLPTFRATVLIVNLTPDMNISVVGSRQRGFRLRCKELPASCLARLKRAVGDG